MVGCWIVGASGAVASTTVALASLIAEGTAPSTGLLTETERFKNMSLVGVNEILFGGHEVTDKTPLESFACVMEAAAKKDLVEKARIHLKKYGESIKEGFTYKKNQEHDVEKVVARLASDIRNFMQDNCIEEMVVVNLATTEPEPESLPQTLQQMKEDFRKSRLPESAIYAWAACEAGCGYLNFTPSTGYSIPPIMEMFRERGLPFAGRDGKTGETLIKTALAHMFLVRAFRVLSWVGFNILGNPDGKSLTSTSRKRSKCATKGSALKRILGAEPASHVGIEYVGPLGDRKIAWDHILFEGAFGVRMSLQFVWEGVDSVLAAPLVIDLVRLVALAMRRKESGYLSHLALFFKDVPQGCPQHLMEQYQALMSYIEKVKSDGGF